MIPVAGSTSDVHVEIVHSGIVMVPVVRSSYWPCFFSQISLFISASEPWSTPSKNQSFWWRHIQNAHRPPVYFSWSFSSSFSEQIFPYLRPALCNRLRRQRWFPQTPMFPESSRLVCSMPLLAGGTRLQALSAVGSQRLRLPSPAGTAGGFPFSQV